MSFLLLKSLKGFVNAAFAHTVFREPGEAVSYVNPRVYIGALPPKRHREDQNQDYPFIVLRPATGEDGDDGSEITIKIICGIQTKEDAAPIEAGVNDIQNMLDRCRRILLKNRILDKKYRLNLPLTWSNGDDTDKDHNQPHPYYVGVITTRWQMPAVVELLTQEGELEIYGTGYPDSEGTE